MPLVKDTTTDVEGIEFYVCKHCHSQYAKKPGQVLHDRWLMPLSLVLYPVVLEKEPEEFAAHAAKEISANKNLDIDILKEHIWDEVNHPKQKVSQILNFTYPDEKKLRAYLKKVYNALDESIQLRK